MNKSFFTRIILFSLAYLMITSAALADTMAPVLATGANEILWVPIIASIVTQLLPQPDKLRNSPAWLLWTVNTLNVLAINWRSIVRRA